MKVINGGITAAKGFQASGVVADIKDKNNNKKDLSIIFSKVPAQAAGVFTTNRVQAAPVLVSKARIKSGLLQAIVINSGNANACTGAQGMADALKMTELTAAALKIDKDLVAVASTGVIGVPLPMNKIINTITAAVTALNSQQSADAALAIMTTDTYPKEIAAQVEIDGAVVHVGGIAKGSGMISPNMATTLAFVTTDAKINADILQQALSAAIADSFNMITVDGDTSTNDCVIALANGLAENKNIEYGTQAYEQFIQALTYVLTELAKAVVRDGEGATKLFEVQVRGADNITDARKAALAVCNSALVKTAIFGGDANWGRILCALGYSGADFDPNCVDLFIGSLSVMKQGAPVVFDEEQAARILSEKEIVIKAELNRGGEMATGWGCDLSHEYVTINGSYRS